MRILVLAAACVCLSTVGILGCHSKSTGAKEYFAHHYSCPEESVTVKPRPDLRASEVFPYPFNSKPSAEVANDPARLAKWKADDKVSRDRYDGYNDSSKDLFEVSGCTHVAILGCSRGGKRGTVSCDEAKKR